MGDWMKWGSDMASYARNSAATVTTMVAGSELEKRLAEATSNEPWGASGTMMADIAKATYGYDDFKTVMNYVWKNLGLGGGLWRVVYKTLNLLDYLLRHGSERVVEVPPPHARRAARRPRRAPSAAAASRRPPTRLSPRCTRTRATTCASSSGSNPSSSSTPTARTRASTCARRRSSWWSCWTRRTRAS